MMRHGRPGRRGVTLLEVIVTLAVLAVVAGVVSVSIRPLDVPVVTGSSADNKLSLAQARRSALHHGRPVRLSLRDSASAAFLVTALPDGSVIAPSGMGADRLTGEVRPPTPAEGH